MGGQLLATSRKRIFLGGGLETLKKMEQPVEKFKLNTHATVIVVSHFTYLAKVQPLAKEPLGRYLRIKSVYKKCMFNTGQRIGQKAIAKKLKHQTNLSILLLFIFLGRLSGGRMGESRRKVQIKKLTIQKAKKLHGVFVYVYVCVTF